MRHDKGDERKVQLLEDYKQKQIFGQTIRKNNFYVFIFFFFCSSHVIYRNHRGIIRTRKGPKTDSF